MNSDIRHTIRFEVNIKPLFYIVFCFFVFAFIQLPAQNNLVFIDSKFVTTDTLFFDYDGDHLAGTVNLKNFTGKKDRKHSWLFSSNVTLNTSVKKRADLDSDLNGIKMRYSFNDLFVQVKPDFTEPSIISVRTSLSRDTVYRAVLGYPILKFSFCDHHTKTLLSKEMMVTTWVENVGLTDLTATIEVGSAQFICSFDSIVYVKPQSRKELVIRLKKKTEEDIEGSIKVKASNSFLPQNYMEETLYVLPKIDVEDKNKEAGNAWWFWIIILAGGLWFLLRKKNPFTLKKKKDKDLPIKIKQAQRAFDEMLSDFDTTGEKGLDDTLAIFIDKVNTIRPNAVVEEVITKVEKKSRTKRVVPEFKRIEIVQRAALKKYINDQELHERLNVLSEVELVKYIGLKFKDSFTLQKILAIDDQLTRGNIYASFLNYKKKNEVSVNTKLMGKASIKPSVKIIEPNKPAKIEKQKPKVKDNYTYKEATEYLMILSKLQHLFQQIIALEWELNLPLTLLKNKFFGYLGIKEDRLLRYIGSIKSKGGVPINGMSDEDFNRFLILFTDVFNLHAFLKIRAFKNEFKLISFPFAQYNAVLEELKNYMHLHLGIKLLIPSLFVESLNYEYHENTDDVSKILAENVIEVEENLIPGIIKDFSSIGVISKQLSLNQKAKVYTSK